MEPQTYLIIWIAVGIVCAIIEALTVSIVSCWFVVGAIFALLAYFLGANALVQWIVFVSVSAATLLITRPFIRKHNKKKAEPTNADMLIGMTAVVTSDIDNVAEQGSVKVKGLEWTARSEDNSLIPEGSVVTIKSIEGVKLIVTLSENQKEI